MRRLWRPRLLAMALASSPPGAESRRPRPRRALSRVLATTPGGS
ncbi:hypothetical protein [Pseudomonas aeruginosa]